MWTPDVPATQFKPARPTRAVWVRLDALYPHPSDAAQISAPDGWDLVGNVQGVAQLDTWIRSSRGMWLAACNFELTSADGRRTQWYRNQLVPGHAMRVREQRG